MSLNTIAIISQMNVLNSFLEVEFHKKLLIFLKCSWILLWEGWLSLWWLRCRINLKLAHILFLTNQEETQIQVLVQWVWECLNQTLLQQTKISTPLLISLQLRWILVDKLNNNNLHGDSHHPLPNRAQAMEEWYKYLA